VYTHREWKTIAIDLQRFVLGFTMFRLLLIHTSFTCFLIHLSSSFSSFARLCNMDLKHKKILVDIFDWDRFSSPDFMSFLEVTVQELIQQKGQGHGIRLKAPPKPHKQDVISYLPPTTHDKSKCNIHTWYTRDIDLAHTDILMKRFTGWGTVGRHGRTGLSTSVRFSAFEDNWRQTYAQGPGRSLPLPPPTRWCVYVSVHACQNVLTRYLMCDCGLAPPSFFLSPISNRPWSRHLHCQ